MLGEIRPVLSLLGTDWAVARDARVVGVYVPSTSSTAQIPCWSGFLGRGDACSSAPITSRLRVVRCEPRAATRAASSLPGHTLRESSAD